MLPKAPSNYDPVRATERALNRRNYVLREMHSNGYITEAAWRAAAASPLGTIRYGSNEKFRQQGGYFMPAWASPMARPACCRAPMP